MLARRILWMLALLFAGSLVVPASGTADEPVEVDVLWDDGLQFRAGDAGVKLKLGGRVQADSALFDGTSGLDPGENGAEIRRARLYLSGTIHHDILFKVQYDFVSKAIKDARIGYRKIPWVGTLLAGQTKEPFSQEMLTSSNHMTFLERGLPNAFALERNLGLLLKNHLDNERVAWAAGVFRETDDDAGQAGGDGNWAATGRITALPWADGDNLLHIGVAGSYRNNPATVRYAARPEAHLADRLVDTGEIPAREAVLLGTEASLIAGPAWVTGEYIRVWLKDVPNANDPSFYGGYGEAGVFLTGDTRAFKRTSGTFARQRPEQDFARGQGPGAVALAARVSHLDLNDSGVSGGKLTNVTIPIHAYCSITCVQTSTATAKQTSPKAA